MPASYFSRGSFWSRHAPWLTVLFVTLATFFTPLRHGDLQDDAPMYAWFGYRVYATGDWLNLYYDWDRHVPYFNKPPLQFWLSALVYPFTGATVLGARLVPALFATAAALVMYRLVRLQYARPIAASAAVIFCLQYELLSNLLEVRLDAGLLLMFMITNLAAAKLLQTNSSSNVIAPADVRRREWACFLTIGAALGLGVLTRGGIALLAFPVLAVACAWARRWDLLRPSLPLVALLITTALIAGPWFVHAYVAWGHAFTSAIEYDAVGQHFETRNRTWDQVLFYYFHRVPEGYSLWIVPAIFGAIALWRRYRTSRVESEKRLDLSEEQGNVRRPARRAFGAIDRLAIVWIVVWFALIQCSTLRALRYALPMFPWLSLLAAVGIFSVKPVRNIWRRAVLPYAGGAAVVLSATLSVLDVPLYPPRDGEWLRVAPSVRASVERTLHDHPTAPRPTVYMLAGSDSNDIGWQKRCAIQFYTGARTQVVERNKLLTLPHDCWLAVFIGTKNRGADDDRTKIVARELPRAVLLDAGQRYLIYRVP